MLELTPKTIEYLEEQVDYFETLSKKVLERPTMEKVHKLRVATRRIRSILEISNEDIKPLKRLAQVLGKIRDMDVAIHNSAHYDLDPKKLHKRRKRFEEKALKLLQKKNKKKILQRLHHFTDKLEDHPDLKTKLSTQKVEKDLLDWTDKVKDEELHDVRIVLKKARYLFEAAGKPVGYLKKMQDHLGKVHDLEVLEAFYENNEAIFKDRIREIHAVKKDVVPTVKRALHELRKL